VELLERIIDEDVDEDPDDQDKPTVAEGTAEERIISTTDPEMRHGRKSQQGTYDGHKAHIGLDVESGLILDVEVTAPSQAEGELIGDAIERIEAATDRSIEQVLGDSAYGTRAALEQVSDLDVDLRTKMPQPNASWQFGADDFDVSSDGQDVVCPNGETPARTYRKDDGWQHFFAESDCQNCPLREQCTRASRRTFFVADDFHERRRRREWAQSKEGRLELRRRVRVEHGLGRLKQWGAGQARYCGRDKTEAQWKWTATAANLSLIWNDRDAEAPDRRGDRSKWGPFIGSNEALCRHQRRVPGAVAVVRRCAPKYWWSSTRAVTPA
ncbi:MAG: transposase, partial [Bradymonadaceae bacterium]